MDWIRRHPLVSYFVLTFAISWGAVLAVVLPTTGLPAPAGSFGAGGGPESTVGSGVFFAVLAAMLAGPSLASLAMNAIMGGRAALRELGARMVPGHVSAIDVAALAIGPGALLLVLAALSLFDPVYLPGIVRAPLAVSVGGLGAALVTGFLEEIGWTGFATPRLVARYGTVRGALLLGAIWALWHVLVTFWGSVTSYGLLYLPGVLQGFVFLIAFRVIMTVIYQRTGSVFFAQILHATLTFSSIVLSPATSAAQAMIWNSLWPIALALIAFAMAAGLRVPRARRFRPA